MPVRPTLLHRMALVSFLLFRKNLGNLREFLGQIVYRPPWQKIARTPMLTSLVKFLTKTQGMVVIDLSRIPVNKCTNSRLGWTKHSDL